jgi:hypothetical protein
MTRKDFQLIADALQELYLGHNDWQRTLPQVAEKLADALKKDSPYFDRERFLKACGVASE